MSAWIISENHVRLLVEALFQYEVMSTNASAPMTPEALGKLLWRENHKSINHRYAKRARTPHYIHDSAALCAWDYPTPGRGLVRELCRDPWLVLKQIGCYQYQSCEHAGWETSVASAYMAKLEAQIAKSLGCTIDEAYKNRQHFGNAPWGIN